jgi:hypothetical protein
MPARGRNRLPTQRKVLKMKLEVSGAPTCGPEDGGPLGRVGSRINPQRAYQA